MKSIQPYPQVSGLLINIHSLVLKIDGFFGVSYRLKLREWKIGIKLASHVRDNFGHKLEFCFWKQNKNDKRDVSSRPNIHSTYSIMILASSTSRQRYHLFVADGRVTETVVTLEGNTLKKVQVPDVSTGYHTTEEVGDENKFCGQTTKKGGGSPINRSMFFFVYLP